MSSAPAISIVEDLEAAIAQVETRSLPTLAHCFPRSFTFYLAHPVRSIRRNRSGLEQVRAALAEFQTNRLTIATTCVVTSPPSQSKNDNRCRSFFRVAQ